MASSIQENTEPPKERIDATDGQLMVITAFGLDFFQGVIGAIPIAGPIIAPVISLFIWFIFFIWLKFHGVSIGDTVERIALMWGGFLLEIVPLLNILPIWTITILITVLLVQRNDRKKKDEFYRDTHTAPQQI